MLRLVFVCASLLQFKAWELLMKSAFHKDVARQEIGLQPVKHKETTSEGMQSSITQ